MSKLTKHPLFPVPKVYVPVVAGYINVAAQAVAFGVISRAQLAQLVIVTGYALIGWATPNR